MLILHVDGSCRPNPGMGSFGVVVRTPEGRMVCRFRKDIGMATNNIAEWRGLLAALDYLMASEASEAEIRMDSRLVVEQAMERWRVKNAGLLPFASRAWSDLFVLRSRGARVTVRWVAREQNSEADSVASGW